MSLAGLRVNVFVVGVDAHPPCSGERIGRLLPMPAVQSSALKAIDYRPLEHQLVLRFASGEIYAYDQAPEDLYRRFLAAESKGRFFQAEVRGRLPFHKLSSEPEDRVWPPPAGEARSA